MRPLRSLRLRLSLVAAGVLCVTLASSIVLAYEIVTLVSQREVDATLRRERNRFMESLEERLGQTVTSAGGPPDAAGVAEASERYLALNPGNTEYMTIVRLTGEPPISDVRGPTQLVRLRASGRLPPGTAPDLETITTSEGPIRSLSSPIEVGGEIYGVLQVAAPLEPTADRSLESVMPMILVAGISLLLGSLLLVTVVFRGLAPLRDLTSAVRSVDLHDLSARVPVPRRLDEIGSLSRDFNGMLDRLEDAARSRQAFMASISHELRTPLTIATGYVETLERMRSGHPPTLETARVIREELSLMARLIDDLMALARFEAEDFLVIRDVKLRRFFRDLELRLTGLGIDAAVLDSPPDTAVRADPDRLAQAVANLILNASVHNPPGTSIRVTATRDAEGVAFTVADNGQGIDPAIRDRLFEPFVRGATEAGTGSGLGLSVVRAIATAHRGTVEIRTGTGGTTATLRIPSAAPTIGP